MPVNGLRAFGIARPAGGCVVRPEGREWLQSVGLRTARDFLAIPGIVVSGHVGRNVSRVDLHGTLAYLKREHHVRARDRFRSWRDGFGWASISAREAMVLRRLEELDLPGARWLAHGEADGQAFLLVEAADRVIDLRSLATIGGGIAERLGRVVARLHAAGVDQPDLFAKHFLVRPENGALTILDWQRATLQERVPWQSRIRSLAALRASGGDELFTWEVWHQILAAYQTQIAYSEEQVPTLQLLHERVRAATTALAQRHGIRSQQTVGVSQELVRIDGETVCAIPAVAAELDSAAAVAKLYDRAYDGQSVSFSNGCIGTLHVRRSRLPVGRWLATLRGRTWRSPELKAARILFHLERHGIPAPKLLAYGQTIPRLAPAGSFLLFEPNGARPPGPEDGAVVRKLLGRLHRAGCCLAAFNSTGEALGMVQGAAVVHDPRFLRLRHRISRRRAHRDFARLDALLAVAR